MDFGGASHLGGATDMGGITNASDRTFFTAATATGGASTGSTPAYCTIDSVMYANGAPNPSDHCQSCQVDISTSHWVARQEGAQYDIGRVCHNGTCQTGCWISSQYFTSGIIKTNSPCMTCQPAASTSRWTADAAVCGCTGPYEVIDDSLGLCVAKMAQIVVPDAGTIFSIDATEVTKGQYDG